MILPRYVRRGWWWVGVKNSCGFWVLFVRIWRRRNWRNNMAPAGAAAHAHRPPIDRQNFIAIFTISTWLFKAAKSWEPTSCILCSTAKTTGAIQIGEGIDNQEIFLVRSACLTLPISPYCRGVICILHRFWLTCITNLCIVNYRLAP